jgi:hypothetical protein
MTTRLTGEVIASDKGGRLGISPYGGASGRTTITVDAAIPLAIFISPESGPESSAPLLSSLAGFPALREILGLPDRESSPEKMEDDDNNGFKRLFWIP